jgi:hypothetical protein
MVLGVKRKWKKREDCGKDYPGQPETAHMHEIHDVMLPVKDVPIPGGSVAYSGACE